MTTHVASDTTVLLKRSLRHILRSPDTIITTAVTPIAMLLLFVYVFGGSIDTGDGAGAGGYGTYLCAMEVDTETGRVTIAGFYDDDVPR